jgi:Protein of unknown function (DUF3551)
MRILLLVLAISVVTTAISPRAQAQNYPWCAYNKGSMNCGFTTIQQCMADASGTGGFCQPNTQYVPSTGTHSLRQKKSPN